MVRRLGSHAYFTYWYPSHSSYLLHFVKRDCPLYKLFEKSQQPSKYYDVRLTCNFYNGSSILAMFPFTPPSRLNNKRNIIFPSVMP